MKRPLSVVVVLFLCCESCIASTSFMASSISSTSAHEVATAPPTNTISYFTLMHAIVGLAKLALGVSEMPVDQISWINNNHTGSPSLDHIAALQVSEGVGVFASDPCAGVIGSAVVTMSFLMVAIVGIVGIARFMVAGQFDEF
jgi:hypothetical protein